MSRPPALLNRVTSALAQRLRDGTWAPGQRLPSFRELEVQFDCSLLTIQRSLSYLKKHGLVMVKDRSGSYAAEFPPHLHRYGLVLPEQPGENGQYQNLHWSILLRAAKQRRRQADRQIELFYGVNQFTELPEHRRLREAVASRRIAGLIVHDALRIDRWLDFKSPLPMIGAHDYITDGRAGNLLQHQPYWLEAAAAQVRARGLRRTAFIINGGLSHSTRLRDELLVIVRQAGLETQDHWIQGVSDQAPAWASNAASSIMHGAGPLPEALVVADDNLLGPAVAGVLATDPSLAQRLMVIGLANFPEPVAVPMPCTYIGWDMGEALDLAINMIDGWNSERTPIGTSYLRLLESRDGGEAVPVPTMAH